MPSAALRPPDWPVRVVVPGQPVPWARARRRGKRYFTAPEVAEHAKVIRRAWMAAGSPSFPPGQPVSLSAQFHLQRPAGHYGTGRNAGALRPGASDAPAVKPDASNLLKLVEDALNGCWWPDDAQIVCLAGIHKFYVLAGEEPRTVLDAWPTTPRLTLTP